MRPTVFIIVALLCAIACGPVRAQHGAGAPTVPVFDVSEADFPLAVTGYETLAAPHDVAFPALDRVLDDRRDAVAVTVHIASVPEPVSVLMLMCGLLLIVPGGWLPRWSMLGERQSLLRRRPS